MRSARGVTGRRSGIGLRDVLLAIVALGALGLIAELLLLGHFDEWTQLVPFGILAPVLVSAALLGFAPRAATVALFRVVMAASVVTGAVGIWLHFAGNRALELELDGAQRGWELVRHSLTGGTPILAPGAMVQLGLVGLALTWRHPALRHNDESTEE